MAPPVHMPKVHDDLDYRRKFTLMVARFPGNNQEHPDSSGWVMMHSLRTWPREPNLECVRSFVLADTPITMSRNRSILAAREMGCDYLLMIDSDMAPDLAYEGAKPFWETAWTHMMERRKAEDAAPAGMVGTGGRPVFIAPSGNVLGSKYAPCAIAAPYCGPPPHENVYVFRWDNKQSETPNPDWSLEQFSRGEAAIRTGIEEVAALPTGLILYDMRMFREDGGIPAPWFEYEYPTENRYQAFKSTTEDVFQTRNASLIGYPMYVAWDCWAGHWKLKIVGKPQLPTIDGMRAEMRRAVMSGMEKDHRVVRVGTDPNLDAARKAHHEEAIRPPDPILHEVFDKNRPSKVKDLIAGRQRVKFSEEKMPGEGDVVDELAIEQLYEQKLGPTARIPAQPDDGSVRMHLSDASKLGDKPDPKFIDCIPKSHEYTVDGVARACTEPELSAYELLVREQKDPEKWTLGVCFVLTAGRTYRLPMDQIYEMDTTMPRAFVCVERSDDEPIREFLIDGRSMGTHMEAVPASFLIDLASIHREMASEDGETEPWDLYAVIDGRESLVHPDDFIVLGDEPSVFFTADRPPAEADSSDEVSTAV